MYLIFFSLYNNLNLKVTVLHYDVYFYQSYIKLEKDLMGLNVPPMELGLLNEWLKLCKRMAWGWHCGAGIGALNAIWAAIAIHTVSVPNYEVQESTVLGFLKKALERILCSIHLLLKDVLDFFLLQQLSLQFCHLQSNRTKKKKKKKVSLGSSHLILSPLSGYWAAYKFKMGSGSIFMAESAFTMTQNDFPFMVFMLNIKYLEEKK